MRLLVVTPEVVVRAVSEAVGVDVEDIMGEGRSFSVARARRLSMAVARWTTGWSYPELGRFFSRDHSSVIVAVSRVQGDERDEKLARRIAELVTVAIDSEDENAPAQRELPGAGPPDKEAAT